MTAYTFLNLIFIKRFIENVNWIHLDIAGVTWAKGDRPLIPKGGTGFGVRLLEEMIIQLSEIIIQEE